MSLVIVASVLPRDGKSVVAAGLAAALRRAGQTVRLERLTGAGSAERDAAAFALVPGVRSSGAPLPPADLAHDTDHTVVELGDLDQLAGLRAADGATVVLVTRPAEADDFTVRRAIDDLRPDGLVLNAAPPEGLAEAGEAAAAWTAPVLGVLPQDRLLAAPSIQAMAVAAEGDLSGAAELFPESPEWLVVGPISAHGGLDSFERYRGAVVVTRHDKTDVALAALEHEPRCLILTGGPPTLPYIAQRAESESFALIVTRLDTPATVDRLGALYAHTDFGGADKVARAAALVQQHLDLASLTGN